MKSLLPIVFNNKLKVNSVDARGLYDVLDPKNKFNDWVTDKIDYTQAVKNEDYLIVNDDMLDKSYSGLAVTENSAMKNIEQLSRKNVGGIAKYKRKDYILSIHLAKEFAMLERNDTGKEVRKYFIKCEEVLIELLKKKQEETAPRFHCDALAEQHKELQHLYKQWYRRMYQITPTDAQEAQFVIFINETCLGERTFTRQHLTYKGAYRVMAGYQIFINQFKKGYRDLGEFLSMFNDKYGAPKEKYLLRPNQEEIKSLTT
jgi:phage anti-repressor protein